MSSPQLPGLDSPPEKGGKKPPRKPTANPEVKAFIDWWHDRWGEVFGGKYVVAGGKDGATVKRLLGAHSLETLKTLAERFFSLDDDFIVQNGHTLTMFSTRINALAAGPRKGGGSRPRDAADMIDWEELGRKRRERQQKEQADGRL